MLADLFDGVSLWRFVIEYFLDDVSSLLRNAVVKRILSSKHLFIKSVGVLILKRKVSIEHGKENDSAGPDIDLNTIVSFALYHLRSRITWTAACGFQLLHNFIIVAVFGSSFWRRIWSFLVLFLNFRVCVAQAKINYLDVLIGVKKHVFGLEVSVDDLQLVQVVDAIDNLVEKPACFSLGQPFIGRKLLFFISNVVKKFTPWTVLHDQKQVLGSLDYFVELDEIGVADEF